MYGNVMHDSIFQKTNLKLQKFLENKVKVGVCYCALWYNTAFAYKPTFFLCFLFFLWTCGQALIFFSHTPTKTLNCGHMGNLYAYMPTSLKHTSP